MHLLLLLLFFVFLHRIVRLITRGGFRRHHGYDRYNGYGNYGYGRRRHGLGGGLFTILGLVALDRLFGRRW